MDWKYEMKNIKYIEINEINVLLIINYFYLVCPPGLVKLIPFFSRVNGDAVDLNIHWIRMGDILCFYVA